MWNVIFIISAKDSIARKIHQHAGTEAAESTIEATIEDSLHEDVKDVLGDDLEAKLDSMLLLKLVKADTAEVVTESLEEQGSQG